MSTRSCTILLRTFTKTGIHFATRLELPGRSPSHDAYSRLLCSELWHEFLARMKRVNSKCSSVQLRANSAIYSRHSRLVWTHLKTFSMYTKGLFLSNIVHKSSTFTHLADVFIQSDLHSGYNFFVSMCSLGIEPTTFALLTQCSNHWATGTRLNLC